MRSLGNPEPGNPEPVSPEPGNSDPLVVRTVLGQSSPVFLIKIIIRVYDYDVCYFYYILLDTVFSV